MNAPVRQTRWAIDTIVFSLFFNCSLSAHEVKENFRLLEGHFKMTKESIFLLKYLFPFKRRYCMDVNQTWQQ